MIRFFRMSILRVNFKVENKFLISILNDLNRSLSLLLSALVLFYKHQVLLRWLPNLGAAALLALAVVAVVSACTRMLKGGIVLFGAASLRLIISADPTHRLHEVHV